MTSVISVRSPIADDTTTPSSTPPVPFTLLRRIDLDRCGLRRLPDRSEYFVVLRICDLPSAFSTLSGDSDSFVAGSVAVVSQLMDILVL